MTTSYEIRTLRNRPVFAFDDEARARQELARSIGRVGTRLRLVKITRVEEEIL